MFSKYKALWTIRIYVVPVTSQSYATAACTTGTVSDFPKSSVNPATLTRFSVRSIILAYFPTTGESAWLSSSVADTVPLLRVDEIADIDTG